MDDIRSSTNPRRMDEPPRARGRTLRLAWACAAAVIFGAFGSIHCGGPASTTSGDAGLDATEDVVVIWLADAARDGAGDAASDVAASDVATSDEADVAAGTLAVTGHAVSGPLSILYLTGGWPAVTPLPSRHVAVLDAAGKLTNATTDATGGFAVEDVVPPYDAVVFPQAGDGADGPYVYVGLSTPHPRLVGSADVTDAGTTSATQHGGWLSVPLQLGACGATTCELETLISGSPTDGFLYNSNNAPVAESTSTPTGHVYADWTGPSIATTINFDFLEADPSFQHFWTASGSAIFVDTVTADYNLLTLSPVTTLGSVTLEATTTGIPASWGAPTTQLSLVYPDNGPTASLGQVQSTSIVSGVPDIIGATLSASSCAQTPSGATLVQYACAYADALPLSTATIALTVAPPPLVTSPQSGATLPSTGSIAWTTTVMDQVYGVDLFWSAADGGAGQGESVFTSGTSVDVARLVTLGAAPPSGPLTLYIQGSGQVASLDAIVDDQTLATSNGTSTSLVDLTFTLAP